jgi:hypothetical protein
VSGGKGHADKAHPAVSLQDDSFDVYKNWSLFLTKRMRRRSVCPFSQTLAMKRMEPRRLMVDKIIIASSQKLRVGLDDEDILRPNQAELD